MGCEADANLVNAIELWFQEHMPGLKNQITEGTDLRRQDRIARDADTIED
jgi:hypothetical protein